MTKETTFITSKSHLFIFNKSNQRLSIKYNSFYHFLSELLIRITGYCIEDPTYITPNQQTFFRNYSQSRRTVIQMLGNNLLKLRGLDLPQITFIVAVVLTFFACWTPFHSQRLMFVFVTLYGTWSPALTRAQHILFMISGKLTVILSSCLRVLCVLYCVL